MKLLSKIALMLAFGLLVNLPVMNAEVDGGHGSQARQANHQSSHILPLKTQKKSMKLMAGIAVKSLQKMNQKIEGFSHVSSASLDDNLLKALIFYGATILLEIVGAIFVYIGIGLIAYIFYFLGFVAWVFATIYFIKWLISVL